MLLKPGVTRRKLTPHHQRVTPGANSRQAKWLTSTTSMTIHWSIWLS